MIVVFGLINSRFLEVGNWENMARQGTVLLLLAGGVGVVMIGGGLDLSVGSTVSVASVVFAISAKSLGVVEGALLGLAAGAAMGFVNGALIGGANVPPFIATLATLSAGGGLALLISGGVPIYDVPSGFTYLALSNVGPFPISALIAVVVVVALAWVMRSCRFGWHVYALGGNERAAWLAGISTRSIKYRIYVLSGTVAGLGGVLLSSRVSTGQPTLGLGLELQAVAAVLIAGVPLTGGEGSLYRIALAAVTLTILNNGLNLANVQSYWQAIAIGAIIALASLVDSFRNSNAHPRAAVLRVLTRRKQRGAAA
jgi:ribose transport system permease protein